jgi:hypothetical protein
MTDVQCNAKPSQELFICIFRADSRNTTTHLSRLARQAGQMADEAIAHMQNLKRIIGDKSG